MSFKEATLNYLEKAKDLRIRNLQYLANVYGESYAYIEVDKYIVIKPNKEPEIIYQTEELCGQMFDGVIFDERVREYDTKCPIVAQSTQQQSQQSATQQTLAAPPIKQINTTKHGFYKSYSEYEFKTYKDQNGNDLGYIKLDPINGIPQYEIYRKCSNGMYEYIYNMDLYGAITKDADAANVPPQSNKWFTDEPPAIPDQAEEEALKRAVDPTKAHLYKKPKLTEAECYYHSWYVDYVSPFNGVKHKACSECGIKQSEYELQLTSKNSKIKNKT